MELALSSQWERRLEMYKKILSTLDGSKLSEMALPHAGAIAKGMGADLVVLTVAPPLPSREILEEEDAAWDANLPVAGATHPLPPDWFGRHSLPVHGQHTPEQEKEWQAYLGGLPQKAESMTKEYISSATAPLAADGVKVVPEVLFGDPATVIIDFAKDSGADLIVMSTHGESGIGRFFAGSVAQKVLQGATVPVLLVRAKQ
jgi:nucleotide-binding universal stress UspA family protein